MFEKCPNCLKRVIKGSKFCTHCGKKMPRVAKTKHTKPDKDFIDVDFSEGKKIFKRYKKYFFERLKEPTVSMKKSMNKESFKFGLIQLNILVIINSLSILTVYAKIDDLSGSVLSVSWLSLFMGAIIFQAVFLLSMVISLYVSTNYLKNIPTTVQTILSRIGGLATPQLILSVILYLAVTLGISFLYSFMAPLIILTNLVSIIFYLMSIKNKSTIPVFYTVILTMGLLMTLQIIMSNMILRFSVNPQIYPEIIRIILNVY